MKAAQIDNYGDVSVIQVREVEKPTITANQVLVEVSAASLNPFDSSVREGHAQSMAPLTFPATLGLDLAGTVVEAGADVTGFVVGDRVYGTANAMFAASGAFAEYAAANAKSIALAPRTITDIEAASLPTAGISAMQAIVDHLNVQRGQKVFINGGTGGVGSIAIQIAKHLGAYVAVTASTENLEYARTLGADEVIDYKTQKFTDVISDYDAALNCVYSDTTDEILSILKSGGTAASIAGELNQEKASELGVTAITQMTHVSTESLDNLARLVDEGAVKVEIDKKFPLDQIKEAFTARETESIEGKVVITIR